MNPTEIKIAKARSHVLEHFPQLSPLILTLPWQLVKGDGLFVTNKGVVGIGQGFVDKTPMPVLAAGLMHEGFHMLLDHFTRRGERDPMLWNVAGDLVINETLRRAIAANGCSGSITVGSNWMLPEKFGLAWGDGKNNIPTAGQVYDWLLANNPPIKGPPQCGSGAGNEHPDEGQVTIEGTDPGEIKEAMERAAAGVSDALRRIGAGSAEMSMWADAVSGKPKFDPLREFRNLMTRSIASLKGRYVESTYNKINRRVPWLPGSNRFSPEIVCIVDTSGSMAADGSQVLGEVGGMLMRLGKVRVVTVDTSVTYDGYVTSVGDFKAKAKGGGGTDLTPAFQVVGKAALVCITDGELNNPGTPNVEDTVWLITHGRNKQPWMKKVVFLAP